jgi:hypothetical protein
MNRGVTMTELEIRELLAKISSDLPKYLKIMDMLHKTDVSVDGVFQITYNGFYRVRQRTQDFYQGYYGYMEKTKKCPPSFQQTLEYLTKFGKVDPSFASKLIATINPDLPVWDTHVLTNMGFKYSYSGNQETKLKKANEVYQKIILWYQYFIPTTLAKTMISLFDEIYPNIPITVIKKIDLILWKKRN